ncbi:probable ubiquitin-conjugating enzyme E2 C [Schistocerca gregaria]|uniref:probable ubiquitin-conjugating enzyme E2 C n=1 Tax=Schistocerca gregaria TaxID=7010 RepID=UPI00211E0263|nr:probable ubiquitin-conjugating enzyme E2 C [Schistocerca gregaria]
MTITLSRHNADHSKSSVGLQAVSKRLQVELMNMMKNQVPGISAFPNGDNLFKWIASIRGVDGTVYEGLEYKLTIEFSPTYPLTAPVVCFETPCFHPNVDQNGNICLDILKEKWSPVQNVSSILLSIQTLLADPNNSSPYNAYAAALWDEKEEYKKAVLARHREARQ